MTFSVTLTDDVGARFCNACAARQMSLNDALTHLITTQLRQWDRETQETAERRALADLGLTLPPGECRL